MYCVNCGVKLADTEKQCPLCGVKVYHPDILREAEVPLYPRRQLPSQQISSSGVKIILTAMFLLPAIITLLCDLQLSGGVVWSGYAVGALALCYVVAVLPCWFRRPNPVIFVPCDFATVMLYVWGVNELTGGDWFLSFAFPVIGMIGLLTTAVITLCRYVRGGYFFIWGGAVLLLGAYIVLLEMFIHITFSPVHHIFWSFYPLIGCVLLGAFLLLAGMCRPLREALEKKFFL